MRFSTSGSSMLTLRSTRLFGRVLGAAVVAGAAMGQTKYSVGTALGFLNKKGVRRKLPVRRESAG
jgi:hypothetical protein